MKKLRWAMDGAFWDLDVSTPRTLDGVGRPVPGDPLPLGLSRGARLSRPKQIAFMQRFMYAPFVPSYAAANGFTLERVLTIPFADKWYPSPQFTPIPFKVLIFTMFLVWVFLDIIL